MESIHEKRIPHKHNAFSSKFLEEVNIDNSIKNKEWSWRPSNPNIKEIFMSGANTSSNESTYASEKDSRADQDRPNEG